MKRLWMTPAGIKADVSDDSLRSADMLVKGLEHAEGSNMVYDAIRTSDPERHLQAIADRFPGTYAVEAVSRYRAYKAKKAEKMVDRMIEKTLGSSEFRVPGNSPVPPFAAPAPPRQQEQSITPEEDVLPDSQPTATQPGTPMWPWYAAGIVLVVGLLGFAVISRRKPTAT